MGDAMTNPAGSSLPQIPTVLRVTASFTALHKNLKMSNNSINKPGNQTEKNREEERHENGTEDDDNKIL